MELRHQSFAAYVVMLVHVYGKNTNGNGICITTCYSIESTE
jgi:hypothetical protein